MIGADTDLLRVQLEALPETTRRNGALGCLRLSLNAEAFTPYPKDAERLHCAYLALARAKLAAGLDDQLESSGTVQTSVTTAKTIARFLPDGKRPKTDSCKGAKDIWGRAYKGVI